MSAPIAAANPPNPWADGPVDPLGEALHYLRMNGVFYTHSEFTAPWGLELPAMPGSLMFHVVTRGSCLLQADDTAPVPLHPGSFSLVPHGEGHCLLSEVGARPTPLFDMRLEPVSERYELLRYGGGGEPTTMICGAVRLDHPAARHLVKLLPRQIVIDTWKSLQTEWIQSTLRLLAAEAQAMRPGGETIITRLADILVVQAIRSWMTEDPGAKTGWLGALRDQKVGRALLLVHRDLGTAWTVEALAARVAMSRSAFAARFTEAVGQTPMHYVRSWKMQVAAALLADEGATVSQLACRLGYESEAAFSRAFKRVTGVSPGSLRRTAP